MQKALSEIRFCKVGHLALHRSNPLLRRQCLDVSGSVQHAMNRTTERMASKSLTAWVGSLQLVFCRLEVRKESCLVVTVAVQNSLQHCTIRKTSGQVSFLLKRSSRACNSQPRFPCSWRGKAFLDRKSHHIAPAYPQTRSLFFVYISLS